MDALEKLSLEVGTALKRRGWRLATAESCTGGWVGEVVTSVAGSSHWYERGFITYTNESKQEMLGVAAATLDEHGAVSEHTVRAMAQGALQYSHADVAIAISGIAGPGGATPTKPVGMVCIAWALRTGHVHAHTFYFAGERKEVRRQAVVAALRGVLDLLDDQPMLA